MNYTRFILRYFLSLYIFLVYVDAFFDEKARVHLYPIAYIFLQFYMEEKIDENEKKRYHEKRTDFRIVMHDVGLYNNDYKSS